MNEEKRSAYGDVYAALSDALDVGMCNVAPGTEGAITRAILHFRELRDSDAVDRLEKIAIDIVSLQQALRDRSADDYRRRRRRLMRRTRAWLDRAPLIDRCVPA